MDKVDITSKVSSRTITIHNIYTYSLARVTSCIFLVKCHLSYVVLSSTDNWHLPQKCDLQDGQVGTKICRDALVHTLRKNE